jgi:hypothetical protein
VPIHGHEKAVHKKRVKRVWVSSNPEEVMERRVSEATQVRDRVTQKKWHSLRSIQQLLQESVACGLVCFIASISRTGRHLSGNKTVGNWVFASLLQI